jgi:putative selenium metabolism hydrolase
MQNIYLKINELSEKWRDYTANNLSRLVSIKSLSTKEEEVQLELVRQMNEAGFDEVKIDGLGNVIGRIGTGEKIIAIDGHMDTVDTGYINNWSFDPLGGIIKDGYVHGRGAVDQKGGTAAFVTSGRILKEMGFNKNLTIYFVGSVIEEDCEGLCWKYIIEEDKIRPDIIVLTEPTNLNIYSGQRGRMEMQVHFYGVSSHGSAPDRGKNAIYMASKIALEIEKLNERLKDDGLLGKASITVTEIISESPSLCAVPDYARIHIDRRLTTGETQETAVKEINDLINGYNAKIELPFFLEKSFTGREYGMSKFYPSWAIPSDHELIKLGTQTFRSVFGKEPGTGKWSFSTNGIMTCGVYGIPTIGFGPGNEVLAHAHDEKVLVTDLVAASAFYAALIYDICQ